MNTEMPTLPVTPKQLFPLFTHCSVALTFVPQYQITSSVNPTATSCQYIRMSRCAYCDFFAVCVHLSLIHI